MATKWTLDRWIQLYNGIIATVGVYFTVHPHFGSSATTSPPVHSSGVFNMNVLGITLIIAGGLFTLANYLVKRWGISNIESPLFRRSNGFLDWKPIQYEQIANLDFVNTVVDLDGKRYINCSFRHCTFRYEGTAPTELVENCRLLRDNPNESNFILSTSNPLIAAAWKIQLRIKQGGPGVVGERFDPAN